MDFLPPGIQTAKKGIRAEARKQFWEIESKWPKPNGNNDVAQDWEIQLDIAKHHYLSTVGEDAEAELINARWNRKQRDQRIDFNTSSMKRKIEMLIKLSQQIKQFESFYFILEGYKDETLPSELKPCKQCEKLHCACKDKARFLEETLWVEPIAQQLPEEQAERFLTEIGWRIEKLFTKSVSKLQRGKHPNGE